MWQKHVQLLIGWVSGRGKYPVRDNGISSDYWSVKISYGWDGLQSGWLWITRLGTKRGGRREDRKIHPESNTERSPVASTKSICENMGRRIEKVLSGAAFKELRRCLSRCRKTHLRWVDKMGEERNLMKKEWKKMKMMRLKKRKTTRIEMPSFEKERWMPLDELERTNQRASCFGFPVSLELLVHCARDWAQTWLFCGVSQSSANRYPSSIFQLRWYVICHSVTPREWSTS